MKAAVVAFVAALVFCGCGGDCPPELPPCHNDRPAQIQSCRSANADGVAEYTCQGFDRNSGCWIEVAAADGTPIHAECVETCAEQAP